MHSRRLSPRFSNDLQVGSSHWMASVGFLALGYFLLSQIALLVPTVEGVACVFWPASGLALGFLVRYGNSLWPGLMLGILASNFFSMEPAGAVLLAISHALILWGSIRFLRWKSFQIELRTLRDMGFFCLVSVLASSMMALAGSLCNVIFGKITVGDAPLAYLNWWLGDFCGIVMFAPFFMTFSVSDFRKLIRTNKAQKFFLTFFLFLSTCVVLYTGWFSLGRWNLPATFILLVIVVLTASQFRIWAPSLQLSIVCVCVILNNYYMTGPGTSLHPSIRIYAAWAFLVTGTLLSLGISVLLAERDDVEHLLKNREKTYRALVHDNPALIAQFANDGQLLFANETFRRAFNVLKNDDSHLMMPLNDRRRSSSKHNFFEISGLSADPTTITALRENYEPERPLCFESSVSLDGTSQHWFRWTVRAVDMTSSMVLEYHAVGLDVTEQKRAECERKELEEQAIQAQKFEAVGVLAGGIAHEFNNLLTSMIGNTEIALMTMNQHGKSVRPMLEVALKAAERAAELTRQLSIYAGVTESFPKLHCLVDLVNSCKRLMEVVIPKNCKFHIQTIDFDLQAVVDEMKIRQLLMGLVTNAAESIIPKNAEGTITVRMHPRQIPPQSQLRDWLNHTAIVPGQYAELEVSDTGCGMSPETLKRIFEPFYSTKFAGRGLGLSAVLGIVQDHDGAIQVKSEPGRGTIVRVLIPTAATTVAVPKSIVRKSRLSSRIDSSLIVRK